MRLQWKDSSGLWALCPSSWPESQGNRPFIHAGYVAQSSSWHFLGEKTLSLSLSPSKFTLRIAHTLTHIDIHACIQKKRQTDRQTGRHAHTEIQAYNTHLWQYAIHSANSVNFCVMEWQLQILMLLRWEQWRKDPPLWWRLGPDVKCWWFGMVWVGICVRTSCALIYRWSHIPLVLVAWRGSECEFEEDAVTLASENIWKHLKTIHSSQRVLGGLRT